MNEFDVLEFGVEVGEHLFLRDLVLGVKVKQLEQQRQSLLQVAEHFLKVRRWIFSIKLPLVLK